MQLFDENERLTDLGLEVDQQIGQFLQDLFTRYPNVSVRELAAVAHASVSEIETETVLERRDR